MPSLASSPTAAALASAVPAGDLRNARLEVIIPVGRGACQFADGVGTVDINTTYYSRIISSTIFTDRGIAAALIEIRTGQGSPLRQIHLYRLSDTTRGAVLLDKHIGEFHSATKIEAAGQELHVTMDGTVKTYQINQIG